MTQPTLLDPQIDKFFFTYHKSNHPASKDTLARWVKDMLHFSGIDTLHYAAHSCCSASSSKARVSGVPMEQILKRDQWKSSRTFYASTTRILCDSLMLQLSSLQIPSLCLRWLGTTLYLNNFLSFSRQGKVR